MAVQHGRLRLAAEVAVEALARLEREAMTFPPIVGAVHGALGLVYYEQNQPDKARDHLQRGIRLSALSGHNASAIYSQCNLARLLQADGDLDGAARALEAAAALWAQGAPGWVWPELVARQANLALARGDLDAAEAFLRQSGVAVDDPVTLQTDAIHLAWLRLLAARADTRASGLAQRIIRSAEAGDRNGTLLSATWYWVLKSWRRFRITWLTSVDDRLPSRRRRTRALSISTQVTRAMMIWLRAAGAVILRIQALPGSVT